jgi:hypothetical protein
MKTIAKILAAALLMIIAGCGSNQIKLGAPWKLPEPTGAEDALIFGHVIIGNKESPLTPEYVRILRKGKVYAGGGMQGIGEKTHVFTDGRFVARVKPGTFNFNAFYANQTTYQVETGNNPTWFTIGPGQIYYLGSFHAKHERAEKMWRPGEFSVQRVDKPGERELLQWLLTVSKGTGWETKLRRRAGSPVSTPGTSAPNSNAKPR